MEKLPDLELRDGILILLIVVISVFLIIREVICWYYKINKRLEKLEEILHESKKTNVLLESFVNKFTNR